MASPIGSISLSVQGKNILARSVKVDPYAPEMSSICCKCYTTQLRQVPMYSQVCNEGSTMCAHRGLNCIVFHIQLATYLNKPFLSFLSLLTISFKLIIQHNGMVVCTHLCQPYHALTIGRFFLSPNCMHVQLLPIRGTYIYPCIFMGAFKEALRWKLKNYKSRKIDR